MQIWIHKCRDRNCDYIKEIGRDERQKGREVKKILIVPCSSKHKEKVPTTAQNKPKIEKNKKVISKDTKKEEKKKWEVSKVHTKKI